MSDRCEYGALHIDGPCIHCEAKALRARVAELEREVQEANTRAWIDEQQCNDMTDQAADLAVRVAELEDAQLPATITETRERISRLLDHLVELAVGDGEVEP